MAAASPVQALSIYARGNARLQVAVVSSPALVAQTLAIHAVAMQRAVVHTDLGVTGVALVAGVADTRPVNETHAITGALTRAASHAAVHASPANLADTRALVAQTVATTLVGTGGHRAVPALEPRVAAAGVVFAHALQRAVVRTDRGELAGLASKTRIALAHSLVAVTVVVAVVGA